MSKQSSTDTTVGIFCENYELERGKPLPDVLHSMTQVRLSVEFDRQSEFVFSELSLRLSEGKTIVPDLCVFAWREIDFRHDEFNVSDPPLLAVEIFTPGLSHGKMMERVDKYFAFGVKSVWIVSPPLRHVTIFTADGREARFTEGVATDPATDLTADLDRVFRNV